MSSDHDHTLKEAADWYTRIVEDDPGAEVEEAFAVWLEAAPTHAACWNDIIATANGIGQTQPRDRSLWECTASTAPLNQHNRFVGNRSFRLRKPAGRRVLMAACAAALAGFLIVPEALLHLQADERTAAGEMRAVHLVDGSRVILGPDSAMAIEMSEKQRDIRLLKGMAWFEVTPDRTRPFTVTADHAMATVLGTRFDVRTIDRETSVSVAQGRVRATNDRGGEAIMLAAGDRAAFSGTGHRTTETAAPSSLGAWRQGEIVIQNGTVADVIEEIRPWYRGRIVLLGSKLAGQRLSGFYKTDDPVRSIRNIVATYGGRVTTVTPWLVIVTDR